MCECWVHHAVFDRLTDPVVVVGFVAGGGGGGLGGGLRQRAGTERRHTGGRVLG